MCASSNHTPFWLVPFPFLFVWFGIKKIAPDKIRGDDNIRAKRYLIGGQMTLDFISII